MQLKREFNTYCDNLCNIFLNEQKQVALFTGISQEIEEIECILCKGREQEEQLILCDNCSLGFHYKCLGLKGIPYGNFYCDQCEDAIIYKNIKQIDLDPTQNFELLLCIQGMLREPNQAVQFQAANYCYEKGKLYKKLEQGIMEVPPVGAREQIIKMLHYQAGHAGFKRTFKLVAERFYWPKMKTQVVSVLAKCLICKADKPQFYNPPGHRPLKKGFKPFLVVHCDLFYLPRTLEQERAVLLVVDGFSKWVEVQLLDDQKAATVWEAFQNNIIYRYGAPEIVITDNGPEFQEDFHMNLLRREIKHTYTSPLHPQANGQVERYVRCFKTAIRKIINEKNEPRWAAIIQQAAFALRILQTQSTGLSSFEVVFGQKANILGFLQQKLENKTIEEFTDQHLVEYVEFLHRKRHQPIVQKNLQKMESEIMKVMGRRQKTSISKLELGDVVLLRNYRGSALDLKATGPGVFLEFTSEQKEAAIVYNTNTKRVHRVNITNLAPFNPC